MFLEPVTAAQLVNHRLPTATRRLVLFPLQDSSKNVLIGGKEYEITLGIEGLCRKWAVWRSPASIDRAPFSLSESWRAGFESDAHVVALVTDRARCIEIA